MDLLLIIVFLLYSLVVFSAGWVSGARWGTLKALKDLKDSYTELRKSYPNEK